MNPTKSFLGVASGKLLWFVVTFKGIYLDPEKIHAIPRYNLQEVSNNFEDCGDVWLTSKISIKSLRTLPIFHQVDEEGSLIRLGQYFPASV